MIRLNEMQLRNIIKECINEAFKSKKLQQMYNNNDGFPSNSDRIANRTKYHFLTPASIDNNYKIPLSDIEDDDIEDIVNKPDDYDPIKDEYGSIMFKNGNFVRLKKMNNNSLNHLSNKYNNAYTKNDDKSRDKKIADSNARGNKRVGATPEHEKHSQNILLQKSVLNNPERYDGSIARYNNNEKNKKDNELKNNITKNLNNRKSGNIEWEYT